LEQSDKKTVQVQFDNNGIIPMLFGDGDVHLARIEKLLHVSIASRGNMVAITGEASTAETAKKVLQGLYTKLDHGEAIGLTQVDAMVRMSQPDKAEKAEKVSVGRKRPSAINTDVSIKTVKKTLVPYTQKQAGYIESLLGYEMVFALGPAGTGKTYLAVAAAVNMFVAGKVDRIILSRPAVEAGEKLGFLPGDLKDKIDPYLRPLYDALFDMLPSDKVQRYMENGEIEVAPLAFMRGRTLTNAFIILDEAQNTTPTQMKMFLTRLGEGSRMVITGDLSQTDLPRDIKSGLKDAVNRLQTIEEISIIEFADVDVVRHPLAARIVHAYEEWDNKKRKAQTNDNATYK
jgi:phosphate starvation-inducible PhoH-like protein